MLDNSALKWRAMLIDGISCSYYLALQVHLDVSQLGIYVFLKPQIPEMRSWSETSWAQTLTFVLYGYKNHSGTNNKLEHSSFLNKPKNSLFWIIG